MFRSGKQFVALPVVITSVLMLTGCDKDLQQRVDRLEAELRAVRSDTRDQVDTLKTRVIEAENKVGVSETEKSLDDRITDLEASLSEALAMKSRRNEMVYLRPNLQGHAPLNTDHGTFLVRMEGIDLNIDSGGYMVHLNIGNPHAIAINQFSLKGDFGGGTPELPEGQEYSLDNEIIRAWQETLKPFEYRVSKTLEPFSWTPFDIELEADSRTDLEMVRFQMIIESARLNRQDLGGGESTGSSFSHIRVDSKGASVMKTDYGAFLVTVKSSEDTDVGTKLHLEIGNPYGFTINQCRLLGDYGPELPKRADSTTSEDFSEAMEKWSSELKPFESMISSKVSNFRWNKVSILIPGQAEDIKFLRCQLRIEDVTLPAATDK
ncbi:MAG: hypothetical protein CMO55_14240 [Verrucomicrobiales bacterium]|nr:hypothetical protein [Verrucomicrobiales bacterium]